MAKLYPSMEIINKRKPAPTEGEKALINFLFLSYDDTYEIFYQPFLNGDLPDVIMMRKGGGVMIFEVKDWNLNNYSVQSNGNWRVNANGAIIKNTPLRQVSKYKENLYNLHVDSLLSLNLRNSNFWSIVRCAVYFHCHTTDDAYRICLGNNPTPQYRTFYERNIFIMGNDFLSKPKMDQCFYDTWISRQSRYFTTDLYNSFSRILRPSYHTIEQGITINLSDDQKLLAKSEGGARKRIKGVAGSGKTIVLAQRAVNAHKRTKGIVLILTFNITLRNYIHDRISAVREEFAWEYFHISNYHDFITSNMNNVGLAFDFLEKDEKGNSVYMEGEMFQKMADEHVYSNIHLFDGYKDKLPKYDVIFIDETQDYKENWIRIIKDNFASDNAEIVAFADEKQNIYSRELDVDRMPNIPIQVGAWDRKLNKSFRMSKKIALLVSDFQKKFFSKKYNIDNQIETDSMLSLFDEPYIEYHFYNPSKDDMEDKKLAAYIYKQILNHKINSNDVTILSSRISMLRSLDYMLRIESKEATNTMFESEEEFLEQFPNSKYGIEINSEIEKIRKNKKANFWMNRGTIKLSTIHSFKGWESPALFLVIENDIKANSQLNNRHQPEEFSDELVYTGLTRCQNFLFILNMGNYAYDEFFSQSLLVDKKISSING